MTIGELARAAGVPISTVRYYERAAILKPRRRSASNYRLYSEEDAERLRFIRAAQSTGFMLEDVKEPVWGAEPSSPEVVDRNQFIARGEGALSALAPRTA